MKKMRVTQGCGRAHKDGNSFSKKHNDRNFDYSNEEHINPTQTDKNIYWNTFDGSYRHTNKASKMSFEEAELKVYEKIFSKQYEEQMAKHRSHGNYKRVVSLEEWMNQRKHCPEEVVLQIGKQDYNSGDKLLIDAFGIYWKKLASWNKAHGNPFTMLDMACHFDEATPHAQFRRVWHYKENGALKIGQEKALLQAGVLPPKPNEPISRFNNPKQTFDAQMRSMWLDACEEVGLEVERVPLPDGHKKHKSKEDFIREKYEDMLDKTNELDSKLEKLEIQEKEKIASVDAKIMMREQMGSDPYAKAINRFIKTKGLTSEWLSFYDSFVDSQFPTIKNPSYENYGLSL